MVKLKGPALAIDASGTLADTLTFAKWKGRNYLRQRVAGAQPRTGAQVSMRRMMTFLTQAWSLITAANQATWANAPNPESLPLFNIYLRANLERWRNFQAPADKWPITEANSASGVSSEAATGGIRQITVSGDVDFAPFFNWGVMIFRQTTTPVVTAWDNCIAVVRALSNDSFSYVDTPLDPGTYYYNFRCFSDDGDRGVEETEVSAAAT